MAKPPALKVYRTAIGFHDAYVAAPSQKAALKAWGSDRDLFARGVAEIVTDKKLAAPALAEPGVVLKVSRGTEAEQLAALGKAGRSTKDKASRPATPAPKTLRPRRGPRPNRSALDAAEQALEALTSRQETERAAFARQEAALRTKRAALDKAHRRDLERVVGKRDRAQAAFDRAVAKWRDGG